MEEEWTRRACVVGNKQNKLRLWGRKHVIWSLPCTWGTATYCHAKDDILHYLDGHFLVLVVVLVRGCVPGLWKRGGGQGEKLRGICLCFVVVGDKASLGYGSGNIV